MRVACPDGQPIYISTRSNKMKTLYLHIGTPKTATTAIQNFCQDNQDILAKHGYFYPIFDFEFPRVGESVNAHFLLTGQQKKPKVDAGLEKLLEFFETYDNVILSDERIWNNGFTYNCWDILKERLMPHEIQVKVIVYLRRQDEFLFSWWNQRVKVGKKRYSTISWQELITDRPYIQLDYYSALEKIADYVGKGNILVRVFDKNRFSSSAPENTILADFLKVLGLEYTQQYTVNNLVQNLSLSKNNVEIKRHINMLPQLSQEENAFFINIFKELSQSYSYRDTQDMFTEEELDTFLADYKDGNARIAKEYLGAEELFDYSYHAKEKWHLQNENLPTDIIDYFACTSLQLLREVNALRQELEAYKKEQEHTPPKKTSGGLRKIWKRSKSSKSNKS